MKRWMIMLACALPISCQTSVDDWGTYLSRIADANHNVIHLLPERVRSIGDKLSDEQAQELAYAISLALIKDPVNVLKATDVIEQYPDALQQRFGTSLICSMPAISRLTLNQLKDYFAHAQRALESAGEPAKACLDNMQETWAEVKQETGRKQ